MTVVLPWRNRSDVPVVLEQLVRALKDGQLVGVPTDTAYGAAANVLATEAVDRLAGLLPGQAPELVLALPTAEHVLDWAPTLSPLGRRLSRRCWPGPVHFRLSGELEIGLLSRVPDAVRQRLCPEGKLTVYVPGDDVLAHALLMLPAPLVLLNTAQAGSEAATSAERLAALTGAALAAIVDAGPSRSAQPASVVDVEGGNWKVVREGELSADELARRTARVIVFVCTGNTCRSPMAEALCTKLLADRLQCAPQELEDRGYIVRSAGIAAVPGDQAAAEAIEAVKEHGGDLATHVSQPLTPDLVLQADHLFAMTRSHLAAVAARFAQFGPEPRLLDPTGNDIDDPIGADQDVYRTCARQMRQHLERLLPELAS